MSDNNLKRKITFNNKEDSVIINSDSKFVLTAENINEIKSVVNNLSDELDRRLRFNEVFKYAKFNVPKTLTDNCQYIFEVELSDSPDFNDPIVLNSIDTFNKFNIFENGKWVAFTQDRYININDVGKSIQINLSEIISDDFKSYYGRCRWKNTNTSENQEYKGFSLGVFEYNDEKFDNNYITDFFIEGKTSVNEKETERYEAYYLTNDGRKVKVTSAVTFSTLNNVCQISSNELSIPALHENKCEIIKAEYVHSSIKLTAFLNISINPIILEKLKIEGDIDLIKNQEEKSFLVKAIYSDGSIKSVTTKCEKTLSLGSCKLSSNKIIGSGNFDEFGSLIITYVDDDFSNETLTITKYIKYEIDKYESLILDFPETITGMETSNLTYSVKLKFANSNKIVDVTNNAKISLINCKEFECKNGVITVFKDKFTSEKIVTGIVEYTDNNCDYNTISKTFNITIYPKYIVKIEARIYNDKLSEINETFEKERIFYKVFGIYNDGTSEELNLNNINIEFISSSNLELFKNSGMINLKSYEFPEIILINFSYEEDGKKYDTSKIFNVIPIKLVLIQKSLSNNTINPDTKVTFEFEAKYSDNTLKNINDKTKIELAAGNPNLIKEIEKNSITFNAPLTREESLTLMATYFDDDFISENKSIFFVVNVIKD